MARRFVYSFEDCAVTFSHPEFETYTAYGEGLGDFSVSFSNNVSSHTVSTDAAVVVSKHVIKNGTLTFSVIQSSDFNEWLKRWALFLENDAATSDFANTSITIKNKTTGDTYYCKGCTHEKIADQSFQSEAQMREWTILAADISLQ